MRKAAALASVLLWLGRPGGAVEPIPYQRPPDAVKQRDKRGQVFRHRLGLPTNPLRVYRPPFPDDPVPALCPLKVDRHFKVREVATLGQWEKVRRQIRRAVRGYFGKTPPREIPLDAKVEKVAEADEWTLKVLTLAFDKTRRGYLCLLIPKGAPTPQPAVLIYDGCQQGINRICGDLYSRAMGKHWVREGFLVVALEHWDRQFGQSTELCTIGAAAHFTSRAVDYLRTQTKLVDPARIAILGHVYGAEVATFAAAADERIAALVARHSWMGPTRPYRTAFWGAPFWADGTAVGGHVYGADRAQPAMYQSKRKISEKPLPFLTQEMLALIPPRPYLCVNHMMGAGRGLSTNTSAMQCLVPVYKLYGRPRGMEMIEHRWLTNQPFHSRQYQVDFLLRAMCGVDPGKPPPATVKKILADLRSGQRDRQLLGARRASWWRCRAAAGELTRLIGSDDLLLRRLAGKALQRTGEMAEMFKHVRHGDPLLRMMVAEAVQIRGTEEMFNTLAQVRRGERDRWAWEAMNQALLISPWHQRE